MAIAAFSLGSRRDAVGTSGDIIILSNTAYGPRSNVTHLSAGVITRRQDATRQPASPAAAKASSRAGQAVPTARMRQRFELADRDSGPAAGRHGVGGDWLIALSILRTLTVVSTKRSSLVAAMGMTTPNGPSTF